MGHIYYELTESPVPPGSRPDGNRLYMLGNRGRGKEEKIYIGVYARKDTIPQTFYPSEAFRQYFPNLWVERYGTKHLARHMIGIGTYMLSLGIGHTTGLYKCIHDVFGPYNGNVLYDYAMYAIMDRSNVAYLFKPAMEGVYLFCKDRIDDDKIGTIFSEEITHEAIEEFKVEWVERCVALGIKEVWLAIDGSNSNYESKNSNLSQKGKAKSKKNVEIVSYIWAVSAKDGLPVTFAVNDGSTSDSKAFDEIITFLSARGIKVKGVILDKGFATHPVLQKIVASGYDFVINLKEDSHGTKGMIKDYGKEIYWNIEHLSGKGGLFGIVSDEPRAIFQRHPDQAYIALYFDGKNGSERKVALADKIDSEIVKIEDKIRNGEIPSVSKEMTRYLSVVESIEIINVESPLGQGEKTTDSSEDSTLSNSRTDESMTDGETTQEFQGDMVQDEQIRSPVKTSQSETVESSDAGVRPKNGSVAETPKKVFKWAADKEKGNLDFWQKGFCALASSVKMSAREMNGIYHIRDSSETQYMICKTMLGFEVFRAHGTEGVETRELVCFIAAIIRNRFQIPCKNHGLKTCRVIEELDNKLFLILNSSGGYNLVNKLTDNQKLVLHEVGIQEADIPLVAGEICYRTEKDGVGISQFHDSPKYIRERNENAKAGKPTHLEQENAGSEDSESDPNNVESTNKETMKESPPTAPKTPRKVGRPPGRKNNKTLEREAAVAASGSNSQQKRRGRPPGRKNNKTLEREAAERESGILPPPKRPKGRPFGSKDSKPRKRRTKAEINKMQTA